MVAYLDDILVYTKSDLPTHTKEVKQVLSALETYHLKANSKKCEFHKEQVEFLGFIVGRQGIKIDPQKTKSVQEWPAPKNLKEVQSFLGLANYNRRFIKDYSKIAVPLTELTMKDKPFSWTRQCEKAFQQLKQASVEAPTLAMFDTELPIQIETDASDRAIGACLTQEYDGKRHPIAYHSRKMSPAEQNYDIHDKELLAIVVALQQWRVYAEGAPGLTIFTDHKNLLHFTTTKELNRRQVRWSELLGQYKFQIKYTPGKDNGRADALSRRSDYMEGHTPAQHSILRENADGTLSANVMELNVVLQVLHDKDEEFPTHRGKIRIPPEQETECIQTHHDDPTRGHPGINKTTALIQRNFLIPKLREKVTSYIAKCIKCNQDKSARHAPYGRIRFSEPPTQPWQQVTMDFITGLPNSPDPVYETIYNAILVVVCRLTKYAHFVACQKTVSAEQLGYLILDRVMRHHGIPEVFVTDRDKLFTSKYWRTLVATLGINGKLSTAFHPQTDGQTERANQTLETYLRHYVNANQDNWAKLLPVAQIALNDLPSDTTKVTPFFANNGRNIAMPGRPKENHPRAENAMILTSKIIENITNMHKRVRASPQQLRKKEPQLKEGDKVFLLTKNLKTKKPSKKLDRVKVGPFLIAAVKGPVNYQLELPKGTKIHPVFHISLLEPANPSIPVQTTPLDLEPEEELYEVEKILRQRGQRYLVKWKGYPDSENTWEPQRNFVNSQKLLRQFQGKQ